MKNFRVIFLMVVFQLLFCSFCHAVYLLENDEGDLSLKEWRHIHINIQEQVWMEGKNQSSLILPQNVKVFFVPDSLMQAFALRYLHDKLQEKLKDFIPAGYENNPGWPLLIIHPEEFEGEVQAHIDARKLFKELHTGLLSNFRPLELDKDLEKIISQYNPPPVIDPDEDDTPEPDWSQSSQRDAERYYLTQNFREELDRNTRGKLQTQFDIETNFLKRYKTLILNQNWFTILENIYPPLNPLHKQPHFINLAFQGGLNEPRFLERFIEDLDNLKMAILFEEECESKHHVALLRGTDEIAQGEVSFGSVCFNRGYYSGIMKDIHASPSYRSTYHRYFVGLSMDRRIFSDLMVIPPLSWYRSLGLGGELDHPRTTLSNETPLTQRVDFIHLGGRNNTNLLDKVGVFIKQGDPEAHYSAIQKLLGALRILKDNAPEE